MNCQHGDLAIIVRDDDFKNDLGKIVECIDGPLPHPGSGTPAWLCRTRGDLLTCWDFDREVVVMSPQTVIPDAWLRPLPPPSAVDRVHVDLPLEVPA